MARENPRTRPPAPMVPSLNSLEEKFSLDQVNSEVERRGALGEWAYKDKSESKPSDSSEEDSSEQDESRNSSDETDERQQSEASVHGHDGTKGIMHQDSDLRSSAREKGSKSLLVSSQESKSKEFKDSRAHTRDNLDIEKVPDGKGDMSASKGSMLSVSSEDESEEHKESHDSSSETNKSHHIHEAVHTPEEAKRSPRAHHDLGTHSHENGRRNLPPRSGESKSREVADSSAHDRGSHDSDVSPDADEVEDGGGEDDGSGSNLAYEYNSGEKANISRVPGKKMSKFRTTFGSLSADFCRFPQSKIVLAESTESGDCSRRADRGR